MDTHLKPTTVVIFGVSGDLARNKLLPALKHLFVGKYLPEHFHVVGVSRRDWGETEYQKYLEQSLGQDAPKDFLERNSYVKGQFNDPELYKNIGKELARIDDRHSGCSNKLFYLAVPPSFYQGILEHISSSGLSIPCGGSEGWTRLLIEKPFGNDSKTAMALDMKLGKLFKEEQIFRIDHYLAKETIQNILAFRFSNSLFEPLWNRKHISAVDIKLFEKNTVADRGDFYDMTGALKDVGQNHLLQMLSLVAMERPRTRDAVDVRDGRARVLQKLHVQGPGCLVRGQYEGFLSEEGVAQNSKTETFFSVKAFVRNRRWRGVPFYITSGKALAESRVEINVYFKDDEKESFLPPQQKHQEQNRLTFSIQPHEGISVLFWSKMPGFESKIEPKVLSFEYGNGGRKIDAYERVLRDCVLGDQTLFASTDEILSAWSFIEKVSSLWQKNPLHKYSVGSEGPAICKDFIRV